MKLFGRPVVFVDKHKDQKKADRKFERRMAKMQRALSAKVDIHRHVNDDGSSVIVWSGKS